jgi:hypothetical protein
MKQFWVYLPKPRTASRAMRLQYDGRSVCFLDASYSRIAVQCKTNVAISSYSESVLKHDCSRPRGQLFGSRDPPADEGDRAVDKRKNLRHSQQLGAVGSVLGS